MPWFALLFLAFGFAASRLLTRGALLAGLAAALPLFARLDALPHAGWLLAPPLAAGLALGALGRGRDFAGGVWWRAQALYAAGFALALLWLLPFPGDRAAAAGVAALLRAPFERGFAHFEFPAGAAWLGAVACLAAYGVAGAREDGGPQDEPPARALARGLRAAAVLGATLNLFALLALPGFAPLARGRFGGGFPDPNSAGTFWMVALAASAAALPARETGETLRAWLRRDPVGWAATGLAALVLLQTGSRITLLGLPPLAAAWLIQRGVRPRTLAKWALPALAGGWLLLYAGYRFDQATPALGRFQGALTRLYQITTPDYLRSQGVAYRLSYWTASLRIWKRAPVQGVGPGRLYGYMGEGMRDMPFPVQLLHENGHNQWIHWLAELGAIGLALGIAGQVAAWRRADGAARLILLAFWLTALTGHPLLIGSTGLLCGLLLGVTPAATPPPSKARRRALWIAPLLAGLAFARPLVRFADSVHPEAPGARPGAEAFWWVSCPVFRRIAPTAAAPVAPLDAAGRRGAITLLSPPAPDADGRWRARVRLSNRSDASWPALRPCSEEIRYVHAAYHWRPRPGAPGAVIEGNRTPLPRDLGPGESVELTLEIEMKADPAAYEFVPDALQEGVAWFELPVDAPAPAR